MSNVSIEPLECKIIATIMHLSILPCPTGKLWLVTELLTGGDLSSRKLNEHDTKNVIEQVLRALVYLHRMGM